MSKRTGKYYLKFTLISIVILFMIIAGVPALILGTGRLADYIKEKSEQSAVEKNINDREKARNQGVLLEETPDELLARVGVIYHDGDSLDAYYPTEPIKVKSDESEFVQFCKDYFGSEANVNFFDWEGECYRAQYGEYVILRTELFNPVEHNGQIYYEEPVGMEGMTNTCLFYYDSTGKYALVKFGQNNEAIAIFLGLTLDGKDDDYNPFVNQKYQQEEERLDEVRNVGVILDVAPEELTKRAEDTFDGSEESLYAYFGASEPIKIDSESEEFEIFCREFFFDHPEPVTFYRTANETISAMCGEYEVFRTEYFNPTSSLGQLYYTVDGLEDGMSLTANFVYDITGKYAMIWNNYDDNSNYVLAKFIGLKFSEQNPYISPNQDELDNLSLRCHGSFDGNIWEYAAHDSVVRVESDVNEFVQYCEELFIEQDEKIVYWPNNDGENIEARCGDYVLLRTQYFDPVRHMEDLIYEDDSLGDTAPVRSKFFYDCTGKYALVYIGNNSQEDYENQLCIKFLGF